MHGVAIKVRPHEEGRSLIIEALPDGQLPAEAELAAIGFLPEQGRYIRTDSQISLSSVRSVFPLVEVREFDPAELVYQEPEPGREDALSDATRLTRRRFVEAALAEYHGGAWRVSLGGIPMEVPPEVLSEFTARTAPTTVLRKVHQELVLGADRDDATRSRVEVMVDYIAQVKGEAWYRNRSAEVNVSRLLSSLGILERMMDLVRTNDQALGHCRLKNPPYQDLAVEVHPGGGMGDSLDRLYLTHYRDDGQADGEMVFKIAHGRLWFEETAVQGMRGEVRGHDRSFATLFSRNLLAQGFDVATIEWSESVRHRPDEAPMPSMRAHV